MDASDETRNASPDSGGFGKACYRLLVAAWVGWAVFAVVGTMYWASGSAGVTVAGMVFAGVIYGGVAAWLPGVVLGPLMLIARRTWPGQERAAIPLVLTILSVLAWVAAGVLVTLAYRSLSASA